MVSEKSSNLLEQHMDLPEPIQLVLKNIYQTKYYLYKKDLSWLHFDEPRVQ